MEEQFLELLRLVNEECDKLTEKTVQEVKNLVDNPSLESRRRMLVIVQEYERALEELFEFGEAELTSIRGGQRKSVRELDELAGMTVEDILFAPVKQILNKFQAGDDLTDYLIQVCVSETKKQDDQISVNDLMAIPFYVYRIYKDTDEEKLLGVNSFLYWLGMKLKQRGKMVINMKNLILNYPFREVTRQLDVSGGWIDQVEADVKIKHRVNVVTLHDVMQVKEEGKVYSEDLEEFFKKVESL